MSEDKYKKIKYSADISELLIPENEIDEAIKFFRDELMKKTNCNEDEIGFIGSEEQEKWLKKRGIICGIRLSHLIREKQ